MKRPSRSDSAIPIGAASNAVRKRCSAAAMRSTLSRSAASAATRSLTSRTIACPSIGAPVSGSSTRRTRASIHT